MERTVSHHIQFAPESEILCIGGDKLQMIAKVAVHIDRILYIIMVEGDTCSADGRREGVLQEPHIIIVDIHIGEHLLQGGVKNLASLYHLSDTVALLSLDDIFLALGILAVNVLRHGLIDTDGKSQFVIIRRCLHLVEEILALLEELALQLFRLQVVERQGNLLILVILIEGIVGQVCLLLGGDDAAHQFHGGVVLALILAPVGLHHHLTEFVAVVLHLDLQVIGVGIHLHRLCLVAQCAHRQHPSRMLVDGKLTLAVARYGNLVSLVLHTGIRHSKAVVINDAARYFLLCNHLH